MYSDVGTAPQSKEILLERIHTSDKDWQKEVKRNMAARQPFELITDDPEWNPTSNDPLDLLKWIFGSILPDWVVVVLKKFGVGLGYYAFPRSEVITTHSPSYEQRLKETTSKGPTGETEQREMAARHAEAVTNTAKGSGERAAQHDGLITKAAIAGAGTIAIVGAATLIAGILNPEPMTKTLLVATGGGLTLAGGGLLVSILYMRNKYEWEVVSESDTGRKVWKASPRQTDK